MRASYFFTFFIKLIAFHCLAQDRPITFFKSGYLVLPKNYWEFNKGQFPLDDDSFIFIRYSVKGFAEPIKKKLANEDGQVVLDRSEFLSIDGDSVKPEDLSNLDSDSLRDLFNQL